MWFFISPAIHQNKKKNKYFLSLKMLTLVENDITLHLKYFIIIRT